MVNPNPDFWRGRRVLVTGHTGFKGTWLCMWLQRLGAIPLGLSLAPETDHDLCVEVGLAQRMESVIGDIRDGALVSRTMQRLKPDIVLHLAAQALVRKSYGEPVATFDTNVMGTVHVLEAVRQTPSVQAVVVVTSDKCYENREWCWAYRETEALGGHDPYSASKAATELVVGAWRNSFFDGGRKVAIASARAGNVIGGGDWALDRLVPDAVRAMSAGRTIAIRSPRSTRPWQLVLEPLSGYLLLAEHLVRDGVAVSEAWNFGPAPDDIQPVSFIVDRVVAFWGDGARWEHVGGVHPHEAGYLAVDASKARSRLGWSPRLRLAETLDMTASWYKRRHLGESPAELVLEQLQQFELLGNPSP